jgi:sporulation protein YlmC with PRC-barrel domain
MTSSTQPRESQIVLSEDLRGETVYDAKGERLGTISSLAIDKASGRIVHVVLMVSGFLGLGHSHRQISWSSLHYDTQLQGYVSVSP